MKQQIENIIKKNLPEKKEIINLLQNEWGVDNRDSDSFDEWIYSKFISQINTSLIVDEVLKVVVETRVEIIKRLQEIRREILKNDPHIANQLENIIIELNK